MINLWSIYIHSTYIPPQRIVKWKWKFQLWMVLKTLLWEIWNLLIMINSFIFFIVFKGCVLQRPEMAFLWGKELTPRTYLITDYSQNVSNDCNWFPEKFSLMCVIDFVTIFDFNRIAFSNLNFGGKWVNPFNAELLIWYVLVVGHHMYHTLIVILSFICYFKSHSQWKHLIKTQKISWKGKYQI